MALMALTSQSLSSRMRNVKTRAKPRPGLSTIEVSIYGTDIRLEVLGADLATEIEHLAIPRGWVQAARKPPTDLVYQIAKQKREYSLLHAPSGAAFVVTPSKERLLATVENLITTLVATYDRQRAFIRGALFSIEGRLIMVAALRGSGTSFLLGALRERGAQIHSDKWAVFNRKGSLACPTGHLAYEIDGEWRRSPCVPIQRRGNGAAQPVALIAPTYQTEARPAMRRMSPAESVAKLSNCWIHHRRQAERFLPLWAALCDRIPGYALERGEAREAVEALLSLLLDEGNSEF